MEAGPEASGPSPHQTTFQDSSSRVAGALNNMKRLVAQASPFVPGLAVGVNGGLFITEIFKSQSYITY